MCISNNSYPAVKIDFKDTILYGARVRNPDGAIEHVLAYFNKVATIAGSVAKSNSPFGWETRAGRPEEFGWDIEPVPPPAGNAMLFAVPIKRGSYFGKENLIPVGKYPTFMQDYKKAVAPKPPRRRSGLLSADSMPRSFSIQAEVVKGFDGGVYDVVIAPSAKAISSVIGQVDEDKRPTVNQALYAELDVCYPGFAFVLFCFAESDAERAGCAAIRFTPMRENIIFLPGLDGHNGAIERGDVTLNHTLVVGSFDMSQHVGEDVEFADLQPKPNNTPVVRHPEAAPYWMLSRVIGTVIPDGTEAPQGDFLFNVDDVKKGVFRCRRQVPPGWRNLSDNPVDPGASGYYMGQGGERISARG